MGQQHAAAAPRIDAARHRFPFCLVWTPIHPLSWFCPYVGHCGICDAEGRIFDFAGPYYVGLDSMLFGWPTRYMQLPEARAEGDAWDRRVIELASSFEQQSYTFLTWNCHSLVAAALNRAGHRPDALARCFGGWSIAGVALLFCRSAEHTGAAGRLVTWGPHLSIWAGVLVGCVRDRSFVWLRGWLQVQAALFAFWGFWFGALAACRCRSQFGRCEPEPSLARSCSAVSMASDVESEGGRDASPGLGLASPYDYERPAPIQERALLHALRPARPS